MWSRFVVPIHKNVAHRSLACVLSVNSQKNVSMLRFKHITTNQIINENAHEKNWQKKKNQQAFRDKPKTETLFATDDPDVFGSINKRVVEPKEIDAGDIAEEEHYRNIPRRRDQLPLERYADMIMKHIRDKRLKEAIDILEVRMKEDRVKPDYYIYELLIMECGRSGYTKKAFQLYNQMKKRGLKVTGPVYAALFSACANTIHPVEGLKLAENLRQIMIQNGYNPNEIIYNAMIKAFGRCGDIQTAFQLVDEMKDKKLRLKIDTINHLLQVCCSDKEVGFRHALLVWHKMYRKKLMPNVYSFNLMLRCSRDCEIGDVTEMRKVIEIILRASQVAVKMKLNKKGNQIFLIDDKPKVTINQTNSEHSPELEKINANEQSENSLTSKEVCDQFPNLLSKLPHLGSTVQLSMVETAQDRFMLLGGLSSFITEMEETKVRPNVKTFTQLLDNIPSTCDAELELIQKMRYMRVRADIDFFNLLMKRRILRKDYDDAKVYIFLIIYIFVTFNLVFIFGDNFLESSRDD